MAIYSKLIEGLTNGEEHFVKVFTVNHKGRVNNRIDLPYASAIPLEAPANVADFTVSGSYYAATITWTNPTDNKWAETVIIQKSGSAPTSIEDGTEVYRGTGTSVSVSGLPINTTVYFAAFTLNANLGYDSYVTASYTTPNQVVLMGTGYDSSLTGGWTEKTYEPTSANTADLTISNTSASWTLYGDVWHAGEEDEEINYSRVVGYTKNKIDLTNFSKISSNMSSGFLILMASIPSFTSDYNTQLARFATKYVYGKTMDISSVTGSYYVGVYATHGDENYLRGSVSSIILE